MREKIREREPGFSREEYKKLTALGSAGSERLIDFLSSQLDQMYELLAGEQSEDFGYLCNVATSELDQRLRGAGFDSSIVEGEIELGPHHWLTHRINVVKLGDRWIVIDLSVRQLPWFKERNWLCETVLPNEDALREYLIREYHWWIGKKE